MRALLAVSLSLWCRRPLTFSAATAVLLAPSFAYYHLLSDVDEGVNLLTWGGVFVEYVMVHLLAATLAVDALGRDGAKPNATTTRRRRTRSLPLDALGTSLLCSMQILLLMLLLLVPGLMRLTQTFVAMPAVALEGRAGSDAVNRSERLTHGSRWTLFGAWLLIRVVYLCGEWSVAYVTTMSLDHLWGWPVYIVLSLLGAAEMAATATLMVAAYQLLRARHELPDARRIAAVFD